MAALLLAMAPSCGSGGGSPPQAGPVTMTFSDGGDAAAVQSPPDAMLEPADAPAPDAGLVAARPYALHVPATYAPGNPAPLVIMLHGYGTDGPSEENYYFHLTAASDADGFLYAYPNGTVDTQGNRFWNATDACCNFYGSMIDDVAYLSAVIDDIESKYDIDPKRVFIGGHSNGGFMAHRFACDHADRVAAIVSFAGAQWLDPSRCQPAAPVSVVEMHGDQDVAGNATVGYGIAYDGGSTSEGAYPSAPATVQIWADKDGCPGPLLPTTVAYDLVSTLPPVPEASASDATSAADASFDPDETKVQRYACAQGIDVELWTIQGGGHMVALDDPAFGDALWGFFSAHAKP